MGCASLNMCGVARGSTDAYYHLGLHIWDMAAAYLVVKEAGGVVVDTEGRFDIRGGPKPKDIHKSFLVTLTCPEVPG